MTTKKQYPEYSDWTEVAKAHPYRVLRRTVKYTARQRRVDLEYAVAAGFFGGKWDIIFSVPENRMLAEDIMHDCACERDWGWRLTGSHRYDQYLAFMARKSPGAVALAEVMAEWKAERQ